MIKSNHLISNNCKFRYYYIFHWSVTNDAADNVLPSEFDEDCNGSHKRHHGDAVTDYVYVDESSTFLYKSKKSLDIFKQISWNKKIAF